MSICNFSIIHFGFVDRISIQNVPVPGHCSLFLYQVYGLSIAGSGTLYILNYAQTSILGLGVIPGT